jgi:hypothetical protein
MRAGLELHHASGICVDRCAGKEDSRCSLQQQHQQGCEGMREAWRLTTSGRGASRWLLQQQHKMETQFTTMNMS